MRIDWSAVIGAFERLGSAGQRARAEILTGLEQTDPSSATVLTEHLSLVDNLGGFMSTRAPDLSDDDDDRDDLTAGCRVGPWRLEQRIGSGGMGQVWLARRDDGAYDQLAALKLVATHSPALCARFADERQRLARLEHPHIARIIDGGEDADGRPFMVMEYVDGAPVDRWCTQHRLDRTARAALLIDLCDALAHAHARLVLHLDIKSANVLVNTQSKLRLIDFGIAALVTDDQAAGIGRPGRALTLLTAAPEQLEGSALTVATDIFQVGMLGHLLLTGGLPERQSDGGVAINAARLGNPDLAAIIARATALDPAARYASANALAEDLRNWLAMLPVAARGGGGLYRSGLFLRKHWLASAASALALAALVGGLGVSLWQTQRAINARNLALAEEERSDTIRESLYFLLAETDAGGDGQATASSVSRAAGVIGERFDKAPAQYAAVLQALGELQFYLADDVGALATFDRLLARANLVQPEILAQARFNAAQSQMRQGAPDKARALLQAAQSFWEQDQGRWSIRLRDSYLVQSQVMRADDPEGALRLLQDTVAAHVSEYGPDNQRAGVFANNIGTALVALGRLDEAEAAFLEADRIWQAIGLASGFDALNTLNNAASVQLFQNKPEAAVVSFARAVALRDQLFGPSTATAALLSNYGKALLAVGKPQEALEPFARAEAMSLQFSGPATPLHVSVQLGRVEALARLGLDGAPELLAGVRGQIAQMGDPAPLMAAYQLAAGKVALAQNRPDEAQAALAEALRIAGEVGPAAVRIKTEAEALLKQ